jgi:hypothetical protein
MIITINMKNPDAVEAAVLYHANSIQINSPEERAEIRKAIKPWVRYDEYITVKIDTDKQTAVVVPVN